MHCTSVSEVVMADLISRPLENADFSFCWSLYEESTKPSIAPFLKRNWASPDEEQRFRSATANQWAGSA
jgi:hypothetical protein